jgi:hypothetical protein
VNGGQTTVSAAFTASSPGLIRVTIDVDCPMVAFIFQLPAIIGIDIGERLLRTAAALLSDRDNLPPLYTIVVPCLPEMSIASVRYNRCRAEVAVDLEAAGGMGP